MGGDTILYISDQPPSSDSVLAALKVTSCEVVNTNSTQVIALLFLMHSVAAVVVNQKAAEQTSFDVARSLRRIRPDVPIVLLGAYQIDRVALATEEPTQRTVRSFPLPNGRQVSRRQS